MVDILGFVRGYSVDSDCQFGLANDPAFHRDDQDVDSSDNPVTGLCCQDLRHLLVVLVLRQADAFLVLDACHVAATAAFPLVDA